MKLVTYETNGEARLGAMLGDEIIDLKDAYGAMGGEGSAEFADDMIALLEEGDEGLAKAQAAIDFAQANGGFSEAVEDVSFLPPVVKPGKVIALGRNYEAHAKEGGAKPPKYPMLFHKTATSLLGAGGTIVIPPVTKRVDYEAELAVIIGRTCKQVSEEEALDYVAGYTAANDVSARDLQRRTSQFSAGKMVDTFCPLGPALVTRDEVPEQQNLRIQTILNGQVMQDSNTKMMIFNVPFTISYISQITTLEVGDVILTGTPEGVGFARKPPVYLKEGDTITIEVEGVGTLTNSVTEQS
ncbi:MAG: fumarylacetoacetate hydrolase family protein [Ardenticatenaceae bacterium]